MTFTLPELPYPYDALEPHIDARTMEIHHSKHHATYIENLNKAVEKAPELADKKVEDLLLLGDQLPEAIRSAILNNGGGHINHTFFWESMCSDPKKPSDELKKMIEDTFTSIEDFQSQLVQAGLTRFGSGWAWLAYDAEGKKLSIISTPNQENPIQKGLIPLLGVDVWEHAYYLKYQNKRADYLSAWWNVVNWEKVEERLHSALSS